MDNVEEIIEALINEVENLTKEVKVLQGLYNQEKEARLSIAQELEKAQKTVARLNFYLENS